MELNPEHLFATFWYCYSWNKGNMGEYYIFSDIAWTQQYANWITSTSVQQMQFKRNLYSGVRNSRFPESSYETELRKITSHFKLLDQKFL